MRKMRRRVLRDGPAQMSNLQGFLSLPDIDQAAWVQAAGSIIAIVAAIGIGWWQARLARESVDRAQVIADEARQSGVLAIAAAALEHASVVLHSVWNLSGYLHE
jgi:hypothetical protein